MALPFVFANASVLNTPDMDAVYNALGALTIIPCTATGTNVIALTPIANVPTIAAYTSRAPVFAFVAAATSTGNVTVSVSGVGAFNLYKAHGATQASANDILINRIYYVAYDSSLNTGGGGFVLVTDQSATQAPNIQPFTSGSGTYTTPTGAVYLEVWMCAGGGGGGAQATNAGSVGTDTNFGTWTAIHGSGGGAALGNGGAGGTGGINGTGTLLARFVGGAGMGGQSTGSGAVVAGSGGANPFGGAGVSPTGGAAGGNAAANTGAGGSGGQAAGAGGAGGGAGEYVWFIITSPTATYAYTVGAGGAGGAAGTHAGGNGAAGIIIVKAFL